MAGPQAEPWRWPSLDQFDQPSAGFTPADCLREKPEAEADAEDMERLLQESSQQARRIVAEAREQADRIRYDARSEALKETRGVLDARLREIVEEEQAAFAEARAHLLQQIEQTAAERLIEIEQDLTALVAMMAEKVIRQKVEADDGVVLDVVKATIEQAAGADRFVLQVAAPDEELVRRATAELLALADGAEQMEIVADEAIGRGGCIVETERGRFDARIESQIELLAEEIDRVTGEGEAA